MAKQEFKSDKLNSTYWWIIKLDPNHPENYNENVKEITGYSKREGHDEARNKSELLKKKVLMLHSRGYFEKSTKITFYLRNGEFLDKNNSIMLIELTKKDYGINNRIYSDKEFYNAIYKKSGLILFLDRFYHAISNNGDLKELLPDSKPKGSKDDLFDVAKHYFHTRKQLYTYCQKLIDNKHPYEAVMNFQRKYEQRNFANTN